MPTGIACPHCGEFIAEEPEVETYTIPVEVPQEVYEKYRGGCFRKARHGEEFINDECEAGKACSDWVYRKAVVLTPRVQYPPELMSPEIWGIAIDRIGTLRVYASEPERCRNGWNFGNGFATAKTLERIFPNIQLPTLADFAGGWTTAKLQNPNWKGE